MRIVINTCFGGFGLSDKAKVRLKEMGYDLDKHYTISRTDERLIAVVKELGEEANGRYARLAIAVIPDEIDDWEIVDYDGSETIYRSLEVEYE